MTKSETVEQITKALRLELRDAQEKREQSALAEIEKVASESLRTALAAKTARDVDAPLIAIGRLLKNSQLRNSRNTKLQSLQNEAQQVSEFLRQWQDYLAAVDAGDSNGAQQKLQNLSGSGRDFFTFIPRSQLLAKLSALQKGGQTGAVSGGAPRPEDRDKEALEIVARAKTLNDLEGALAELNCTHCIQSSPCAPSNVAEGAVADDEPKLRGD